MAFNVATWLTGLMEQKNAQGGPLYPPETLQDFVALVLLSQDKPLGPLPDDVAKILGAFLARSGLERVKEPAALQKALGDYFRAHPLPAALVDSFQAEFKREPQGKKTAARAIRP